MRQERDPMPKTNKPETPAEQVSRFIETARALGCDEDKERFEAALGKIASASARPKSAPDKASAKAKAKASKSRC
jgi:hypothetical protein